MKGQSRVDGGRRILSGNQHGSNYSVFETCEGSNKEEKGEVDVKLQVLFVSYSERCTQLVGVGVFVRRTVGKETSCAVFSATGSVHRGREACSLSLLFKNGIDDRSGLFKRISNGVIAKEVSPHLRK
eukprot:scaffold655_cov162-Amphora_coffeaeformis.AAC.6